MKMQSAGDSIQIEFTAVYSGTVTWIDADGYKKSAKLNGDPVPFNVAQGESATFTFPTTSNGTLPGLNLNFNGSATEGLFGPNGVSPYWAYMENGGFACVSPDTDTVIVSIKFTSQKDGDGILIVGTLDLGGGFDR